MKKVFVCFLVIVLPILSFAEERCEAGWEKKLVFIDENKVEQQLDTELSALLVQVKEKINPQVYITKDGKKMTSWCPGYFIAMDGVGCPVQGTIYSSVIFNVRLIDPRNWYSSDVENEIVERLALIDQRWEGKSIHLRNTKNHLKCILSGHCPATYFLPSSEPATTYTSRDLVDVK